MKKLKVIDNSHYEKVLNIGDIVNSSGEITDYCGDKYYRIDISGLSVFNCAWLISSRFVEVE